MQSRIIEIFRSLTNDSLELDPKMYAKELDAIIEAEKQLLEAVGENKELQRFVENYDKALGEYHLVESEQYYKEGFKDGAKVMKEICE